MPTELRSGLCRLCWDADGIAADVLAYKENPATAMEPRVKMVFVMSALALNLVSTTIYTPVALTVFCLAVLLAVRVPPKLLLVRLALPLVMAGIVLLTQVFFYGTTVSFVVPLWGHSLVGYSEGLARGLLIVCRVIGGVSLILFLTLSTPVPRLLMAVAWFRAPKTMVELTLLMYRYIFVLLEEMTAVRDAQKVRMGYGGWRQSMRSLSILGGSLILRAYDRAERVFGGMVARGYTDAMVVGSTGRFGRKDLFTAICLLAVLAASGWIGRL